MDDFARRRRQVAIVGRVTHIVTDTSGEEVKSPVGGAIVEIIEGPIAFRQQVTARAAAVGENNNARLLQRKTRGDGLFYFLDLPDGEYTLLASLPDSVGRYGTGRSKVEVRRDANNIIDLVKARADMTLSPTTIRGVVKNRNGKPIAMAELYVKESGEHTFSDSEGRYCLSGVRGIEAEAAKRIEERESTKIDQEQTVVAVARGYDQASERIKLGPAGKDFNRDFRLTPVKTKQNP